MKNSSTSRSVDVAVSALENAVGSVDTTNAATAQAQLTSAFTAFDTAMLDKKGLFGPRGSVRRLGHIPANSKVGSVTTVSNVSGTVDTTGVATLTATLAVAPGKAISGATISFTFDGKFAGIAVSNQSGVATLPGVPVGTSATTETIAASFLGSYLNKPSRGSGQLLVSSGGPVVTPTTGLENVSGTASFGGPATLKATLISSVTNQPVSGATVSFTLDGTSRARQRLTPMAWRRCRMVRHRPGRDSCWGRRGQLRGQYQPRGCRQCRRQPCRQPGGGHAGQCLRHVELFGGPATLVATLTSSVTGKGVAGETISFSSMGTQRARR